MTVKGGTGSGAVRERYSVTIEQGLENAGFEITSKAWLDRFDRFYADTYETYRQEQEAKVAGMTNFYQILGTVTPFQHPTGMAIEEDELTQDDTAIYVLSRQAGEGHDRDLKPGDYLLDEVEWQNLNILSGHYAHLIVIVNVGGMIDLSFMDSLPVSALVFFSQGGEEGGNALADALIGKVNFSGRLTATWPMHYEDIPSSKTYSQFGGDAFNQAYNEGIYVGYRYFDTFGVKPRYPFGYGLSYTVFEKTLTEISMDEALLHATVRVRNTGVCAGRDAVLLYATVPFAQNSAEFKRLVAFGKTAELKPGETEEIILCFPYKELAQYDEADAAWKLLRGDYILRLEEKPAMILRLDETVILEKCKNVCKPQREINEITPPERACEALGDLPVIVMRAGAIACTAHSYAVPDEATDTLVASMTDEQLTTLVCGGGTSPKNLQVSAMGASGCTTPNLYDTLGIPNTVLSDGPAGLNLTSHVVELPDGTLKAARVPHVLAAYRRYLFGMSGKAMLSQMAAPEDGTVHYQFATAWPCSQLLAQSFDPNLLEQVGDAVGKEMEAFGVTVWLAPGMNIQRNPLCGRTFEYYSEDPVVSGKMAAAIVRGVQKHPGKGMSVKHFAANSCELERNRSSSNLTERTLRQIYLRGFEIAVKESRPMTVMAAYNKVNDVYCTNNYDLLVNVLRNEWGFEGLVMSDWDSIKADRTDCTKPDTGDIWKAHSAQCDLVMPGRPDQIEALVKGMETGNVKREDLERSAVRILRMIRQNTVLESK